MEVLIIALGIICLVLLKIVAMQAKSIRTIKEAEKLLNFIIDSLGEDGVEVKMHGIYNKMVYIYVGDRKEDKKNEQY